MDGLMFNTEALCRDATMSAAHAAGYDLPAAVYLATIGLPGQETRASFQARFGPGVDFDQFWSSATGRFRQLMDTDLRLKDGLAELLDDLDRLGIPKAIATSSRHESVDHHLAAYGLSHRFDVIVAKGDYARGKPDPEPFLTAAKRLGVDPARCLALEDSHNGARAAAAAGMATIMVPDLLPATEEMQALCVAIARDLHEVRSFLWSDDRPE